MPTCIVWFVDLDGVRHSVEVLAEGLYKAAVLGLAAFKKHDFQPGGHTQLEVEVRSSITHALTVQKVRRWLERGVKTPIRGDIERTVEGAALVRSLDIIFIDENRC